MIDHGETHNFISLVTVKELAIPMLNSGDFGVSLRMGKP